MELWLDMGTGAGGRESWDEGTISGEEEKEGKKTFKRKLILYMLKIHVEL